jgi:hypothetical protein
MSFDSLSPAAKALLYPGEYDTFRALENAIRRDEKGIPSLEARSVELGGELAAQDLATVRRDVAANKQKLADLVAKAEGRVPVETVQS